MRLIILLIIGLLMAGFGQNGGLTTRPVREYELGDWLSYKNCNYPTSIADGDEFVFFGTSGGILPYHKYGRYWDAPYTTSDGLADDSITAVVFDPVTRYLWAAHRKGISYLTPAALKWINRDYNIHLPASNPVNRIGVNSMAVWSMAPGGFIITNNKILGYDQGLVKHAPEDIRWGLNQDDPLPAFGIYFLDDGYQFTHDGVIIDQEFRRFPVTLFSQDINRDIYGAAPGLGVIIGDDNVRRLTIRRTGPLHNRINAWTSDGQTIWMAGEYSVWLTPQATAGISIYNTERDRWDYYENRYIHHLAGVDIYDLAYGDGQLWVGTDQGLSLFEVNHNRWKRLTMKDGLRDEIILTIALEDSLAWIGTPMGLSVIKLPQLKIKRHHLMPQKNLMKIFKITTDRKNIWVGTDNGLYSIDRRNHMVRHYDTNGQICPLEATVAAEFRAMAISDSLNVFYHPYGLLKADAANERFEPIPMFDKLAGAQIFDMALAGNYLWIGTDRGAFLKRLDDNYQEQYTFLDGLAGNLVFKVRIEGDWVWFGTDQGLTKYQWRRYVF